jgi:hypothetical protein
MAPTMQFLSFKLPIIIGVSFEPSLTDLLDESPDVRLWAVGVPKAVFW